MRASERLTGRRYPFDSPLWLVVVDWPDEVCPTCRRPLPLESTAAYDEDELACFCLSCAHRYLDHDPDDHPPARVPRDTSTPRRRNRHD